MDYKELMKEELAQLKKMGKDRRTIEKALGYSEKYLDQSLSHGGNQKIYEALVGYREKFELGEEEEAYGKFNVMSSQQETIERITRMLEKETLKNEALEEKINELESFISSLQSKQHRRSA